MYKPFIFFLKVLRLLNSKVNSFQITAPHCDRNPEHVSKRIYDSLVSEDPCMIARFGANELNCLSNYLGTIYQKRRYIDFINGKVSPWWWESNILSKMEVCAGFFPRRINEIEQFCEMMLRDIPLVDILGSWLSNERYFEKELANAYKVDFELLNPFFSNVPWTKALEGKKVLVVHPFAETIELQYHKRNLLFSNNLLPTFELRTVKAVQSLAGVQTQFSNWFEALEYMKSEIDKVDFDICLIGAGAYGFPLAAYVKRKKKKGFHLGGSLQLLFGIRGNRWENENYHANYNYAKLMNKHWVRPNESDKPINAKIVEDACYW